MPHADYVDAEQEVGWLEALITSYQELQERLVEANPDYEDEDPTATAEMLAECRRLAERLRAEMPEREPEEAVEIDPDIPF